jgi:hypothetical protein
MMKQKHIEHLQNLYGEFSSWRYNHGKFPKKQDGA